MSLLEVKNLKKVYTTRFSSQQVTALTNVSFSVEEGEYVAIMGESGSGKTTLLNTIGGLDNVTSGNIYINGEKITRFSTSKIDEIRNLNIGYIFQNYYLVEDMTVYDNVSLVLKMLGIKDKEEIKKRVNKARKIQLERYKSNKILSNSELTPKLIEKYCTLDSKGKLILENAFNKLKLSARAYGRILKVARTIADLDESENIEVKHIAEAIQYRSIDRKYWSN